jgi:hypothetical protein
MLNKSHKEIKREADWDRLKKGGSDHYKTHNIEPIDLYRAMGILRHWAIAEICQHALRNIDVEVVSNKDMEKIKHYAEMLKVAYGEVE